MSYYPASNHTSHKYALYSQSLDRFFVVDGLDLWSLARTAQILSSKISCIICVFLNEDPPFSGRDCLTWTLQNKNVVLPKFQTPVFYEIENNSDVAHKGYPADYGNKLDELYKEQAFCIYVLRTITAAKLVDMKVSMSLKTYNEDQNQYLDLIARNSHPISVKAKPDSSVWDKGFLNKIESLLYCSNSIDEINHQIKKEIDTITALDNSNARALSLIYLNLLNEYMERAQ